MYAKYEAVNQLEYNESIITKHECSKNQDELKVQYLLSTNP